MTRACPDNTASRHAGCAIRCTGAGRQFGRRSVVESHSAFTLIELLASSVLTVILMSAILTSLKSSFDETRRLHIEQSRHPSLWLLKEQLRRDVQNARGMQTGPNILQLYGYLATEESLRMPTLKRALVTYQVRSHGLDGILIREERPLDEIVSVPPRRDVVWHGVTHLDVVALGAKISMSGEGRDILSTETGGLPSVPPRLRIVLLDGSQRVLVRETVRHHQEL